VLNEGYWIWVHVRCFVRDWLVHAEGIIRWGVSGSGLLSGGVGAIQFYEGVKDFVGKDGMVIVEVVAGCVFRSGPRRLCGNLGRLICKRLKMKTCLRTGSSV
jgi:hypothetical protein